MSDTREKILWMLMGAAVGAGVALLYAPQSGRHTRRMIARKTEEGRDALAEGGRDVLERSRDLFERGKRLADEASELFERGRKAVGA